MLATKLHVVVQIDVFKVFWTTFFLPPSYGRRGSFRSSRLASCLFIVCFCFCRRSAARALVPAAAANFTRARIDATRKSYARAHLYHRRCRRRRRGIGSRRSRRHRRSVGGGGAQARARARKRVLIPGGRETGRERRTSIGGGGGGTTVRPIALPIRTTGSVGQFRA